MHLHLLNMLAGLAWDPQIRGILIVAVVVVMLPGSIYLLLATNVGARLGFLLAIAGITGWTMILGITWTFYGQGLKGRDPSWKVQEVVHSANASDLTAGTLKTLGDYPESWKKLPLTGSPILGDASGATDNFITKSGRKPKMGHEGPVIKEPTPQQLRWPAEFSTSDQYVVIGGFEKGGNNCLGGTECTRQFPKFIRDRVQHDFFLRHSPHYVTVLLRPTLPNPLDANGNASFSTNPDNTKPVTAVVVLRDLGSVRFPQVMITLASAIIFFVTCHALHRRDKQLMAARASGATPATA